MRENANTTNEALIESPDAVKAERSGKYLTFRLADEEYGLEILKVKEIIGLMSITNVPQTPENIRGVINLRGKVIPVMNLRNKFGMEEIEDTNETCIIVIDVNREGRSVLMGIIVDNVSEVLDIAASEIEDAPSFGESVNTEFIRGLAKASENVIILLDIDKVMSTEKTMLDELTAE
jgi:purine-binding chemotaxis protein CheW